MILFRFLLKYHPWMVAKPCVFNGYLNTVQRNLKILMLSNTFCTSLTSILKAHYSTHWSMSRLKELLQPYYQVLVQKYQQKFYPAMYLPIPYQGKSRSEQPAGAVLFPEEGLMVVKQVQPLSWWGALNEELSSMFAFWDITVL
ncbi:uncharacterized protein [Miscanthus floridulus]|uniref:uncharacterized protein isoform X2 n=1 Tax=Miscanthus floridulus TaxID=154761 RepID=UPI00345AE364